MPPFCRETQNNHSCLLKSDFALDEIHRLEKLQCVKRVSPNDSLVNIPLSVVYSNKWRLVVDASRHLNPFVKKRKVRLDSLDDLADLIQRNDYLAVSDLDSGYWHVPLHPDMHKFCGVSIHNSATGQTEYFQWLVLFLGLCDAVFIFTHLLLPVMKYLRSIGWEGVIYIDDRGTLGRDYLQCL